MRARFEFTISQPFLLAIAIGFDEAHLGSELVERVLQRGADGLILAEIEHYRRDWLRGGGGWESLSARASSSGCSMPKRFSFRRWRFGGWRLLLPRFLYEMRSGPSGR